MDALVQNLLLMAGGALSGIGGLKIYINRSNNNGKSNWSGNERRYVTKDEIIPQLESINNRLGEVREDFQVVFKDTKNLKASTLLSKGSG